MASKPGLTEAEMEVLKVLWDCGPGTVRAINRELEGRGRRWAYTTVATLLHRLAVKGFVASDNLQPWKARILLALALSKTTNADDIQRMFDTY